MASSYPGALDSLTNPVGTDALTSPAHASQHANANDAIEAIEATLGVNPQGAYATVKDRLAVVDLAAGSAATSAAAAAVSASSAAGAAVDAGAAANSAVTALDNFDDRYLGAKSSAPTVDNDGNALLTGALYWNSTSSQMFAYTGTAWTTLANVAQAIEANSSSAALRITQTGAGNALLVEDSANPDATPFVITANGNVGVGSTTAPVSIFVQNDTQAAVYLRTAANNSQMNFQRVNGSNASPTVVASGNDLGIVAFDGYDGTSTVPAAWIRASVDGTPGTNDMPGRLVFSTTADGASTPTERMRITSAGNVGIGTSSPASKLHVYDASTSTFEVSGDGNVTLNLRRASTNNSSVSTDIYKSRGTVSSPTVVADGDIIGQWQFKAYDGSAYRDAALMRVTVDGAPGASDMPGRFGFWTAADGGTALTERMRIDNAGLITGSGTSLGAWTAYTPTLGGTGWAIGNGTATGAYCQIGKLIFFRAEIVFGSTSTFGASAEPTITGPGNVKAGINGNHHLQVKLLDSSTSAEYLGWASTTGSSPLTFSISYLGTNSQRATINSTTPFTWATSDRIQVTGFAEAA